MRALATTNTRSLADQELIEILQEQVLQLKAQVGEDLNTAQLAQFSRQWNLTSKEALLLAYLHNRRGGIATKAGAMTFIYQECAEEPEQKIIDVFICKLRRKLGGELNGLIETSWGVGYFLTPAGVAACDAAMSTPIAEIKRPEPTTLRVMQTALMTQVLVLLAKDGEMTARQVALRLKRFDARFTASALSRLKNAGRVRMTGKAPSHNGQGRWAGVYDITVAGHEFLKWKESNV